MSTWHQAATTTVGLFWMAFWAFGLGYVISAMIQVFVTRERMKNSLGDTGASSVGLGALFGFISSSCSFSALASTRSLFAKGAGLVPSLAFMLASTNLVIELGIVIAVFLGWQFVVGEYVGGILLILLMWLVVRLTASRKLVETARQRARAAAGDDNDEEAPDWKKLILSQEGWRRVANRYVMEWHMVWKDVTIGFTVAGIIAAFVPRSFFQALFVGSDSAQPAFWEVFLQSLVGPVAAFFTFIGSMGNIPLAAVLYDNGVSFAGIMAFIFSDLVVLPVLRIQAQYYGWRMALYILGVFFVILVASAMLMHYGFAALDLLPEAAAGKSVTDREFFALDYTLALNLVFIALSAFFLFWHWKQVGLPGGSDALSEKILFALACGGLLWLGAGLMLPLAGLAAG
ncbi:permease [Seongchinamella sediminis]|uniref:Permease n=1 Tax=Seongchinamella sediminis TaxID=2283635 RepID=A0A3L7E366_9GAMM|nr:permease [Seongchinamella sediminis]RLQ23270.1 permease [Seongchinamella sediminis]